MLLFPNITRIIAAHNLILCTKHSHTQTHKHVLVVVSISFDASNLKKYVIQHDTGIDS